MYGECCFVPPLVSPTNPVTRYVEEPAWSTPCLPGSHKPRDPYCGRDYCSRIRHSPSSHHCHSNHDDCHHGHHHDHHDYHHDYHHDRHHDHHDHCRSHSPHRCNSSHRCHSPHDCHSRHNCHGHYRSHSPHDCHSPHHCESSHCSHSPNKSCCPPPRPCPKPCKPVRTKYVIPCYRYEDGRIVRKLPVTSFKRNGMQDQEHSVHNATNFLKRCSHDVAIIADVYTSPCNVRDPTKVPEMRTLSNRLLKKRPIPVSIEDIIDLC